MSQPPPAPAGVPGAPRQPSPPAGGRPPGTTTRPRHPHPVRRLVLVLGAVIALLLVATGLSYRFGDPTRFDPTVAERLAVTDEHGISKQQYSESGDTVRETVPDLLAVARASDDYYGALTAGGDAAFDDASALLTGLDRAQQAVDAIPALANPEVAERGTGYDEALGSYREDTEALLGDAERLAATAPCHPAELGSLDPAADSTLELVRQCRQLLTEVGGGSSPVAGVARDSAVYLGTWAESIESGDEVAADEDRSLYQLVYLQAVQTAQRGVPRTAEAAVAAGSAISSYCDRAAFVSAAG